MGVSYCAVGSLTAGVQHSNRVVFDGDWLSGLLTDDLWQQLHRKSTYSCMCCHEAFIHLADADLLSLEVRTDKVQLIDGNRTSWQANHTTAVANLPRHMMSDTSGMCMYVWAASKLQ